APTGAAQGAEPGFAQGTGTDHHEGAGNGEDGQIPEGIGNPRRPGASAGGPEQESSPAAAAGCDFRGYAGCAGPHGGGLVPDARPPTALGSQCGASGNRPARGSTG